MNILEIIWKYIAGPIVADAQNTESAVWQGITAFTGYNPVNTVLWACIATAIIYGVYIAFQKYGVKFDTEKVIYSMPFVLLGGLLRFIQDTGAVNYPYSIILITPVIYVAILLLYGVTLATALKLSGYRDIPENNWILYIGFGVILLPLVFTLNYFTGVDIRFDILLTVLAIPVFLTGLYKFTVDGTDADSFPYHLIVFSQFFGGAASMMAVTQGYEQKQLITQAFTGIFGAPGVLVAKTGLSALVIYTLLDVEEEEIKALAVLVMTVVGFATGLRVLLRMLAGV